MVSPSSRNTPPARSSIGVLPVVAFVAACTCIAGSIAVVYTSNNRRVGYWIPYGPSIQPSVLLAIFSSVSKSAIDLLLSGGVTLMWWRSAKHGTTLADLHYIWNKGDRGSLSRCRRAFLSSTAVRKIMVSATLVGIASLASNPLLQRASHSVMRNSVWIDIWGWAIPDRISDGWTGAVDHSAPANLLASPTLQQTLQDMYANRTIINTQTVPSVPGIISSGCGGTCNGTASGAELSVNCVHSQYNLDLSALENANATLFSINFTRYDDSAGWPTLSMMNLFSSYVDSSCNATISIGTCDIQSATVLYDIVLYNDSTTLNLDSMPAVLSLDASKGDSIAAKQSSAAGILAGMEWLGYYYFQSNATLDHNVTDNSYATNTEGILANQYYDMDPYDYDNLAACGFQYYTATEYVIKNMHEAALRFGFQSSNGTITQQINMTDTEPFLVYESVFAYLWVTVGIMLAALLSSITLFLGPRDFGGSLTLSPLETAAALKEVMSQREIVESGLIEAEKLVDELGDTTVHVDRGPRREGNDDARERPGSTISKARQHIGTA